MALRRRKNRPHRWSEPYPYFNRGVLYYGIMSWVKCLDCGEAHPVHVAMNTSDWGFKATEDCKKTLQGTGVIPALPPIGNGKEVVPE